MAILHARGRTVRAQFEKKRDDAFGDRTYIRAVMSDGAILSRVKRKGERTSNWKVFGRQERGITLDMIRTEYNKQGFQEVKHV